MKTVSIVDEYENKKYDWRIHPFLFELRRDIGIRVDWEHIGYKWLPYEQALKELTFKNAVMKNKDTIPSIYNYCDRWCERCPFTSRCANFALGEEYFPNQEDRDINNEHFCVNEPLSKQYSTKPYILKILNNGLVIFHGKLRSPI